MYDIKQTIGQGEFGEVKLATNTENGENVAIKVVPKSNYKSQSGPSALHSSGC